MAKISQLPAAGPLIGNEALPIVQGDESRRVTFDQFRDMLDQSEAARERIRARALLFGIANAAEARLFAAEATEVSFADAVFRSGYASASTFAALPSADVSGDPPIGGLGVALSDAVTVGLFRPAMGDVTVIVELDVPAFDGTAIYLASFVGDMLESRVAVYRSDTGIFALQVYHPVLGLRYVAGPQDSNARRIRVAFTVGPKLTRVSFDGGAVLSVAIDRPPTLLRLWMGRLSRGYLPAMKGYCIRAAIYPRTVSDTLLMQMAGGPVTDDEIAATVAQTLAAHDHDIDSHGLTPLRQQVDLAESKTGLWSIKAADSFTGNDGSALGNAEVGGLAWQHNGLVRKGGRIQHPSGGYASAWLDTGNADGQVEADLYPGTSEASLYARLNATQTQWLLLQRASDGSVTLNLQFAGQTTRLAIPVAIPVVAGERFKMRFIGPRIWVFRIVDGVETLLFDVTEKRLMTEKIHGVRLNGGGSADNFRILARESI